LFQRVHELLDGAELAEADHQTLQSLLAWFDEHLKTPPRFNRSRSKGHYRRTPAGIAWFRDSATEHLARMHSMKAVVESYGHPVTVVRESRVGYVVYEDDVQVIAEPFSDTRTK
jgi:hypothetical protein